VGIYLRRKLPLTPADTIEQRLQRQAERVSFGPVQYITYTLLALVFLVLVLNVLSTGKMQVAIRPVLLVGTVCVVALVVIRQVCTMLENERLTRRQADALERLEQANLKVEEQANVASARNVELEAGVQHLKDVQARIANGNLQARASLTSGDLLPLAISLNLMAERLSRVEQVDTYSRNLREAIQELSIAIERYKHGSAFVVPTSCRYFPEIIRLLASLELREGVEPLKPVTPSFTPTPATPRPTRLTNVHVGRNTQEPVRSQRAHGQS
jgi:hypothetical protein